MNKLKKGFWIFASLWWLMTLILFSIDKVQLSKSIIIIFILNMLVSAFGNIFNNY